MLAFVARVFGLASRGGSRVKPAVRQVRPMVLSDMSLCPAMDECVGRWFLRRAFACPTWSSLLRLGLPCGREQRSHGLCACLMPQMSLWRAARTHTGLGGRLVGADVLNFFDQVLAARMRGQGVLTAVPPSGSTLDALA